MQTDFRPAPVRSTSIQMQPTSFLMTRSTVSMPVAPSPAMESASGTEVRLVKLIKVTWIWLLLALAISGGVAYYWAKENASNSYELESRLIFNKSFFGAPLYQSPDVHTLLSQFMSKDVMEELIDKRGLQLPADSLAKQIKGDVARGEGGVTLKLQWADQEEGVEILNQLVDLGIAQTLKVRDQGLDNHIKSLRDSIDRIHAPAVDELKAAYKKLSREAGVDDIEVAYEQLTHKLELYEAELRSEDALYQAVDGLVSRLNSPLALVNLVEPKLEGNTRTNGVSPTIVLNRIDSLEEEIKTKRHRVVLESRLKNKQAELQRIAPLVDRGLMPQSRMSDLLAEVEELKLEVSGDSAVMEMEDELAKLKGQISSYGEDPRAFLESLREAGRMKVSLDTQYATSRVRLEHLQEALRQLEPDVKKLEKEMVKAKELSKRLSVAETKLEEKVTLVEGLEALKAGETHGFSVVESAAPTMTPMKSDFRKLYASAFILSFLALSTPIIGLGTRYVMPSPATALAERMHLTEIGAIDKSELRSFMGRSQEGSLATESTRLPAIRLQYLTRMFSFRLVHVIGLSGPRSTNAVTKRIGESLARLGEEVTVVLAGYPAEKDCPVVTELHAPEQHKNLRVMVVRESRADEVLAILHPMLSERSLVLVTGLDCKHRSDVELMTLKSDAVILSSPAGGAITDEANDLVSGLKRFNVPVLGVIS